MPLGRILPERCYGSDRKNPGTGGDRAACAVGFVNDAEALLAPADVEGADQFLELGRLAGQ
ncbi:MAG TPA: hypothetical protein P5081_03600, partial [Phycisphaerae bacterium]|nr:hypothetical protein [Phycisphaerae bacterium]